MTALGWAATDTWTLIRRDLLHWVRQPAAVLANTLLFPIMIVLMFGYLLGGAMNVPGGGAYREFLIPGMFAMTMVFGIGATLVAVGADTARGVTDRFRSMPTAGAAVLLARVGADMLGAAVTLVVLAGCGLLVGWQPHRDGPHTAYAFALLLLLRFAFCWIGVYLGVAFHGDPETVTAVRTLEFPIGFLANPFVAIASMPGWLGAIASWNPLSATVTATRQLFANPAGTDHSWVARHAVVMAIGWPLVITAVFLPLSIRAYRRLDRR
jgi:ABC-type multidrug transport system permease subunit